MDKNKQQEISSGLYIVSTPIGNLEDMTFRAIDNKSNDLENKKLLKIGVLVPLSGEFKNIGESFLKAIHLALKDISTRNIKFYHKDSKANAFDSYHSAKEIS